MIGIIVSSSRLQGLWRLSIQRQWWTCKGALVPAWDCNLSVGYLQQPWLSGATPSPNTNVSTGQVQVDHWDTESEKSFVLPTSKIHKSKKALVRFSPKKSKSKCQKPYTGFTWIYTRDQPLLAVLLPESFLNRWVRTLISTKTVGVQLHHFQANLVMGVANEDTQNISPAGESSKRLAVTGSLLHDVFRQLHVLKPQVVAHHIEASQNGGTSKSLYNQF